MTSRAEITTRFAKAYVKASKKNRGLILDQVVSVTGWSRDNARRRLTAAAKRPPGTGRNVAARSHKQRAPKYSYDALKVLQRVWAASGGQCGKYLGTSMALQLDGLERHGELEFGRDRYSPRGACRTAGDECGQHRSLSEDREGQGPDIGCVDDETLTTAAQFDQDPQSRR